MKIRSTAARLATGLLLLVYWSALALGTHWPHTSHHATVQYNDKLAHYVGYAGLAFLISMFWSSRWRISWRAILIILALCMTYGALDELSQMLVPGRSAEVADWVADSVGALSGIAIFLAARIMFKNVMQSEEQGELIADGENAGCARSADQ